MVMHSSENLRGLNNMGLTHMCKMNVYQWGQLCSLPTLRVMKDSSYYDVE